MSGFKVKISESEVFPEVKILKPDPFFDYRGEMWTFWSRMEDIKIYSFKKKCSSWITWR